MATKRLILAGLASLVLCAEARADFGISARTSAMGGIGAATARGGESIFYNPGLLALTPRTEVSLSANAYGFSKLTYESYYELSGPGETESADLSSTDILAFPTAASTVYPMELFGFKQALGLGIFVPFGQNVNSEAFFDPERHPSSRLLKLEQSAEEYWFAGSYAIDFGLVSVGVSLIDQLAQFEQNDGFTATEPGPTPQVPQFFVDNNTVKGQAVDLRGAVGAAINLSAFKFGLMVLSPTINAYGSASWRSQRNAADSAGNEIRVFELKNVGAQWAQPLELRAGVAVDFPGTFSAGVDLNLEFSRASKLLTFDPVDVDGFTLEDDIFLQDTPINFNISVGAEYWATKSIGIRAGFFTRFDNNPNLATEDEIESRNQAFRNNEIDFFALEELTGAKIQDFGGTLGFAYVHAGARTDFGVTTLFSTGNHVSILSEQNDTGDKSDKLGRRGISGYTLLFSLGGTYGFGEETKE